MNKGYKIRILFKIFTMWIILKVQTPMYENWFADCLICLALLMGYLLLVELVRAYILYDMNKQASPGGPAAKYLHQLTSFNGVII